MAFARTVAQAARAAISLSIMTNDLSNALARIDRALIRIEQANQRPTVMPDSRYDRLRERTQAALAQLDVLKCGPCSPCLTIVSDRIR